MSRILLDTHSFVWWVEAHPRVRSTWLDLVLDEGNTTYVSAVTGWEIETKKRIKKIEFDGDVGAVAGQFGFELLSVTMSHAALAGALDWGHRDPFDRMLVAQAIENDMTLLSADDVMKSAPGVRVL